MPQSKIAAMFKGGMLFEGYLVSAMTNSVKVRNFQSGAVAGASHRRGRNVQIMLSTIALFSSSRRHGNTGRFIDRIARVLNIEVVDLGSRRIAAYDYKHLNRNDDFQPLMKQVLEHDLHRG